MNAATAPLIILASLGIFAVALFGCIKACKKLSGSANKPVVLGSYLPAQPAGGFTSAPSAPQLAGPPGVYQQQHQYQGGYAAPQPQAGYPGYPQHGYPTSG